MLLLVRTETYENSGPHYILSTWSSVTGYWISPTQVPDPERKWWDGVKAFTFFVKGAQITGAGEWDDGGLLRLVKNPKRGFLTYKVKT